MTSNLASDVIQQGLIQNKDLDEIYKEVQDVLKMRFRPEFLNRVDDVVIFKPLSNESIKRIIKIFINEIQARLNEKNIKLYVDESALNYIAGVGYDQVYGARPLKRFIQKYIETELAKMILSGKVKDGNKVEIKELQGRLECLITN